MSISSTQRVQVTVAECLALVEAWDLAEPMLCELEAARQQIAQGVTVDQLVADRRTALTPVVAAALAAPLPDGCSQVAIASSAPFSRQVEAAVARYQTVARHAIQDAVVAAVQSPAIGFSEVRVCAVAEGTAIEARRGHSVVHVVVHDNLRIDRDWALGPGDACTPLDGELSAQLAARGIATTSVWTDRHSGRRDGVHLIAAARASDPAEPVRGAATNLAVRRQRSTGPKATSRPASRTALARGNTL